MKNAKLKAKLKDLQGQIEQQNAILRILTDEVFADDSLVAVSVTPAAPKIELVTLDMEQELMLRNLHNEIHRYMLQPELPFDSEILESFCDFVDDTLNEGYVSFNHRIADLLSNDAAGVN